MKPLQELIDEHDGDLAQVIPAMQQAIPHSFLQQLGLGEVVQLYQSHVRSSLLYIAGLVIDALDQVGALPEGGETEMANVRLALEFDLWRQMYEAAAASPESGGLVVAR